MRVVGSRRSRCSDDLVEDFVEVRGKLMTPRVNIDRRGKGLDVDGFLYAPPDPVLLRGKGSDVLFPEMVLMVAGVLEHSRLIFPQGVGGGGGVLL